MLSVKGLEVYYGAIHALHGVSFDVAQGEIVSLIGANGAGKSTVLKTLSGLLRAKNGEAFFMKHSLRAMEPHSIVQAGLAQVPEGRRVFQQMTVQENLEMGAFTQRDRAAIEQGFEHVFARFPRLKERRRQLAGTLSGGEQQMLAMGRALMSVPKLLMLDEPSMGLSPILVNEIFSIIAEVSASGTTILLVEQNARMALSIAHRAYVLETGRIVMSGDAKELLGDDAIQKAYLGH
ncbi:MAG: ABC transporter ATP-binding protein [Oscillospiraceae bacterium]|jgi:branched-chain amino acid transport system ATP-binding protein|nr:ABC transporter ATP-binding protein [Oscillospiraceae bacterium]